MIRIPLSPSFLWSGFHTFAGNESFRPFPNIFANNAAGWAGKNLHFYLYGCSFCIATAVATQETFNISIEEIASDGVTVLATHVLHTFAWTPNATEKYLWAPPNPSQLTFQPNASTQNLGIMMFQGNAGSPQLSYNILMDCDLFNTGNNSWVTGIGGGATGTPIASAYGSGGELF